MSAQQIEQPATSLAAAIEEKRRGHCHMYFTTTEHNGQTIVTYIQPQTHGRHGGYVGYALANQPAWGDPAKLWRVAETALCYSSTSAKRQLSIALKRHGITVKHPQV